MLPAIGVVYMIIVVLLEQVMMVEWSIIMVRSCFLRIGYGYKGSDVFG